MTAADLRPEMNFIRGEMRLTLVRAEKVKAMLWCYNQKTMKGRYVWVKVARLINPKAYTYERPHPNSGFSSY